MPPPEPRSSTVSPSRRSISAVGLPQPSEASTASSGNPATSFGGVEIIAHGIATARAATAASAARSATCCAACGIALAHALNNRLRHVRLDTRAASQRHLWSRPYLIPPLSSTLIDEFDKKESLAR